MDLKIYWREVGEILMNIPSLDFFWKFLLGGKYTWNSQVVFGSAGMNGLTLN